MLSVRPEPAEGHFSRFFQPFGKSFSPPVFLCLLFGATLPIMDMKQEAQQDFGAVTEYSLPIDHFVAALYAVTAAFPLLSGTP